MTPDVFIKETLSRHLYAVEDEKLFRCRKAELAEDWPDWCGLPMAAVQAILGSHGLTPIEQAAEMAPLTAALLWRRSKIIYRFDPALRDALAAQPLDGDIPADALYMMPYPCCYVEYPCEQIGIRFAGFMAWMEYDLPTRVPELRLLYLPERDGEPIPQPVILAGTLEESMRALGRSAAERGGTLIPEELRERMRASGAPMTMPPEVIRASISLLLYLCSEAPDIPDAAQIRERRSYDRDGVPKRPATAEVGPRIGAALRSAPPAAPAEDRPAAQHAHASPVPHIRRAHWHHFWAGARDSAARHLILRWIPPVPVAMPEDTEQRTVIRPVK